MEDSLFTKIIQGEIPCHKIYEDLQTFAFLDIHPIQPGHVIVVPKTQVAYVWDLESPAYLALMEAVQTVALHIRKTLQVAYVGEQIVGVDVPHAHVHLIPFSTVQEFHAISNTDSQPDQIALAAMVARLRIEDKL